MNSLGSTETYLEPTRREIHLGSGYPWAMGVSLIKERKIIEIEKYAHINLDSLFCKWWKTQTSGLKPERQLLTLGQNTQRGKTSGEAWSAVWYPATRSRLLTNSLLCLPGCVMLSHIMVASYSQSWRPGILMLYPGKKGVSSPSG